GRAAWRWFDHVVENEVRHAVRWFVSVDEGGAPKRGQRLAAARRFGRQDEFSIGREQIGVGLAVARAGIHRVGVTRHELLNFEAILWRERRGLDFFLGVDAATGRQPNQQRRRDGNR